MCICMAYVHVSVSACAHACMCMCICGGQRSMSAVVLILTQGFDHEFGAHQLQAGWPVSHRDSPVCLPGTKVTHHHTQFSHGC